MNSRSFKIILLLLLPLNTIHAKQHIVFPEMPKTHKLQEFRENPKLKGRIAEIDAIKIDKKFTSFKYNSKFAKVAKLDPTKAIKLPDHINAVGLSVVETLPETEYQFPEYTCKFHYIIEDDKNLWLPPGEYGGLPQIVKMDDDIEELVGAPTHAYHKTSNYSASSFIGVRYKNFHLGYPGMASNIDFDKFLKGVFPNMTYLEFDFSCHFVPEYVTPEYSIGLAIYIEDVNSPRFSGKPMYETQRTFHEFPIPNEVIQESCKYIFKGSTTGYWNNDIFFWTENTDFFPNAEFNLCKK